METGLNQEKNVQDDLEFCEKEAIHLIGHVQSHGYLLAVSKNDYTVQYASENCSALFDEPQLLGLKLEELDKKTESKIKGGTLTELLNVQTRIEDFKAYNPYKVTINQQKLNLVSTEEDDMIILSLEPQGTADSLLKNQIIFGEIIMKLNLATSNYNDLMQVAANQLKKLLNFDRIMIYRFWEDWHGEVIAEAKNDDLDPYLGLHYPASDIPKQARELYKKNLVRLIADVNSAPIPIHSMVDTPLDLSFVPIRSVSPIHIEYLKNMGVGASYSISILHKGELWGLIACHNTEPIFLDYDQRKASEIISQYISNLIELKIKEEVEKTRIHFLSSIEKLETQMREDWDVTQGLTEHSDNLLNITRATGAALSFDGKLLLLGKTPNGDQVKEIIQWLQQQRFREKSFHTTQLSHFLPQSEAYGQKASGLLALTISEEMKEYILWFKPEQLVTVHWAGKNDKLVSKDKEGNIRISPRKSFESWAETVRNTSEPWAVTEINAALRLLEKVHALVQLKSNEIRRLNEKLNQAYEELDSFSYTLSHDLKTPLNTIKGYLELFMADNAEASGNIFLSKMASNADLMQEMISSILQYSKISREETVLEKVNVIPLVEQVAAQMKMNRNVSDIEINLPDQAFVMGNKTMIYQIFLNLVDNAIKYTDSSVTPKIIISAIDREEELEFKVADNGIGIAQEAQDKIFGLFSRIPTAQKIEGTGVGLAIVKRTVEKQKGRIWVESKVGSGSTFHFALKKQP